MKRFLSINGRDMLSCNQKISYDPLQSVRVELATPNLGAASRRQVMALSGLALPHQRLTGMEPCLRVCQLISNMLSLDEILSCLSVKHVEDDDEDHTVCFE